MESIVITEANLNQLPQHLRDHGQFLVSKAKQHAEAKTGNDDSWHIRWSGGHGKRSLWLATEPLKGFVR